MKTKQIQWNGLDAIEITTSRVRMVAVTGLGPRIAFLGVDGGENLLFWDTQGTVGRGDWHIRGGHRVWNTRPQADESEDAYAPDNSPCDVAMEGDALVLTGQMHPYLKIRRGFKIAQVNDTTFEITSFVTNCSDVLFSGGAWAITCAEPNGGKQFGIPLGDRRRGWDLVQIAIPRAWAGHTAHINDPQITMTEDLLIVKPTGIETKRMVTAPLGIIAMTWPEKKVSFAKRTVYNPAGQYPLGFNVAFYVGPGNFMLEMESMGPEQTLLPGDTVSLTEIWKISDTVLTWQSPEELKALFD